MPSRSVGEIVNGQMEVLSVGQSVDKRSGQTMLKTRVRYTTGPFKGQETLIKQPAEGPKAKGTAKKTASKSTSKAAKSTAKSTKAAPKKSTGKAKQVKPTDDEIDVEDLEDLDFDDDE